MNRSRTKHPSLSVAFFSWFAGAPGRLRPSEGEKESAERARSSALGDGSMRERGEEKREKEGWRERELESEREAILLCSLSLVHQILNEGAIKLRMKRLQKSEDSKSFFANRKRTEVRDVQGGFQGDLPFLFSRDLGWLYKQDTPKMALCNLW